MLDSCRFLEQEGFRVTYLPVASNGLITVDDVAKAIRYSSFIYSLRQSIQYRPETSLVSVMSVNNEIGVVQPIAAIGMFIYKI